MTGAKAVWYLSRGTGVTSLALLTLALVLGVLARGGRPVAGLPRFVTAGLHRNVSLLATLLLGVHITTAVVDRFALTGVIDVVVPFRGGYRPLWVGLGTLALDITVAVLLTTLLRDRLADRTWRAVHLTAYATWPLAAAHGTFAGTDAGAAWSLTVTGCCVAAVGAAVLWRVAGRPFRAVPT